MKTPGLKIIILPAIALLFYPALNRYSYTKPLLMNQVIFAGKDQFVCTLRQVPVTNALGFVRTILQEYELTDAAGRHYKLYKTHSGNWFDMDAANPATDNAFLTALKIAIAGQENSA